MAGKNIFKIFAFAPMLIFKPDEELFKDFFMTIS